MASVKRIVKEDGVVLEKIFKEATNEFTNAEGKKVAAQPDRYILRCVSGEDFNEVEGFISSNILDYKVEKGIFDKALYLSDVVVRYELSNFGAKSVSVELKI